MTRKDVNMMVKDFLWGTFNYRNKGIPLHRLPMVGYHYSKLMKDAKRRGIL